MVDSKIMEIQKAIKWIASLDWDGPSAELTCLSESMYRYILSRGASPFVCEFLKYCIPNRIVYCGFLQNRGKPMETQTIMLSNNGMIEYNCRSSIFKELFINDLFPFANEFSGVPLILDIKEGVVYNISNLAVMEDEGYMFYGDNGFVEIPINRETTKTYAKDSFDSLNTFFSCLREFTIQVIEEQWVWNDIKNNKIEKIQAYMGAGIGMKLRNDKGRNVIEEAAYLGKTEILKLFTDAKKRGLLVLPKNSYGQTEC